MQRAGRRRRRRRRGGRGEGKCASKGTKEPKGKKAEEFVFFSGEGDEGGERAKEAKTIFRGRSEGSEGRVNLGQTSQAHSDPYMTVDLPLGK